MAIVMEKTATLFNPDPTPSNPAPLKDQERDYLEWLRRTAAGYHYAFCAGRTDAELKRLSMTH